VASGVDWAAEDWGKNGVTLKILFPFALYAFFAVKLQIPTSH